jgi:hypothetical protein
MRTWKSLAWTMALGITTVAMGQGPSEPAPDTAASAPKTAASRVTAVTVYQGNALVTREVDIPQGRGLAELVVTQLPAQTVDSSLHAEGTDGLRVLSTRYRARAVKEHTRKEVRAKEAQIHTLQLEAERIQSDIKVIEQNLQLLIKLEGFTGATMQQLTEKGLLNSEATLALTKYVMTTRAEKSTEMVGLQQKLAENNAAIEFAKRELAELTAGSSHVERDAIIVVDNPGPAGKVRLNYLVTAATWRPQYRFRAGGEKDPIQLQYLAAIEQQSGEDWSGVDMTLSTAQPQLNATPPDLLALDIAVVTRKAMAVGDVNQQPQQVPQMQGQGGSLGLMAGGAQNNAFYMNTDGAQMFRDQSRLMREKAQAELLGNRVDAAKNFINGAAALEQAEELLARKEDSRDHEAKPEAAVPPATTTSREGPSVTYHLRAPLTVPSRNDQQLIEVARIETEPEYYYKAVPVLTSHVYRLADLVNKGEHVLLPGEATMYVGSDFVGRMNLPLVAIGEKYTVGFGVDPQLQVSRVMVKKTNTHQGGNQVHSYDYRITIGSYKSESVKVQLWDRLPRAEAEAVAVSLVEPSPKLSDDAGYKRNDRPQNLLRWDLTLEPGQVGEKAATVAYQFKLEYARDVTIANFKAAP